MSRGFVLLSCLLFLTCVQTSWEFSRNRFERRISSAEALSNEESSSSDSSEQNEREEYYDDTYKHPKQSEYIQVIPLNKTNSTDKNYYVIKAVVYEVGILTDVPENDTEEDVKNERIDISLFNKGVNGSVIDLQHIPFPVQANISGQVITGIAPVSLDHILGLDHQNESEGVSESIQNSTSAIPLLTPEDVLPVYNTTESIDNKRKTI